MLHYRVELVDRLKRKMWEGSRVLMRVHEEWEGVKERDERKM